LGDTRLRAAMQCARACCALQRFERMRYIITRQAERLTPAPQCTSVAAGACVCGGGVRGKDETKAGTKGRAWQSGTGRCSSTSSMPHWQLPHEPLSSNRRATGCTSLPAYVMWMHPACQALPLLAS
jgi:hypothetical protein